MGRGNLFDSNSALEKLERIHLETLSSLAYTIRRIIKIIVVWNIGNLRS